MIPRRAPLWLALLVLATGCFRTYDIVRQSPPGAWRGTPPIVVTSPDWSQVLIDDQPHQAFAAQLAPDRQPLLYGDMQGAGETVVQHLLDSRQGLPLVRDGTGPRVRIEILSWRRGYWAFLFAIPTTLMARVTLERAPGSSDDVMETTRTFQHTISAPNPASGMEWVAGRLAVSIRDWLMECLTR